MDISEYAGGEVWVRFEVVTDAAVNGEGLLLDDIYLEAIGYQEDFEDGNGGWEGAGFVLVENRLPQEFGVSLIWIRTDGIQVERVDLGGNNHLVYDVEIGVEVREIVLVVSGLTRFTNQQAEYSYRLSPLE